MADASGPNDAQQKPESTHEAPEDLLSLAKRSFEAGKLGDSMVALEAGKTGGGAPEAQINRQKLVVRMHILAGSKEWWKVLGLENGATESDVRAAYKKLAAQVHPDKCSCFGAERAFQILGEAVSSVLGSAEGGFVKASPAQEKHAWWERWDGDSSRKRKREPEPTPQSQEEELHLRSCTIDELKAEVGKRQGEVLRPEKGSAVAKLTAGQRQLRVRAARAILNERMAYAKNAPAGKKSGGFL